MMSTQEHGTQKHKAKLGRPNGSTELTKEEFWKYSVEAYRYLSLNDSKRPTQGEVASRIGVVRATFNNYQNRYGITWSQIRESGRRQLMDYQCSGASIPDGGYAFNWT